MTEPATGQATEIAIVGIGAVFPGAANAAAFWQGICAGTDAITDVPPDRWDPGVYCDPEQAGAMLFYCRRGGFLGETGFDPAPFGIMPSSVEDAEPDQLLMLRVAAEAIADCGTLPGTDRVGVIIGRGGYLMPRLAGLDRQVTAIPQLMAVLSDLVPGLDRARLQAVRTAFETELAPHRPQSPIGLVPNFAASWLANRFNLHGPAYTVDAACASSLVAVDHAVTELASGRCDAVLAGGVHTCHHPALWSVFTQLGALSPGGVIRPLSASADGTLLSEGAGAVLLKRLADARQAGDHVYAVIRGTGISSDGRATSLMSPLAEGQELAIRRAWAAAGLDPAAPGALGLLEAHGTATPTGDRAELTALARVFGPPRGRPAGIGSVKSMIGHAMPAAGIAGLIKAALAVDEAILPPTLHAEEPSPALAATMFEPVTAARPWDDDAPVRRAAVSAFGFGGINAHVIIEADQAPAPARRRRRAGAGGGSDGEAVLRLSAGSATEMAALLAVPDARLLDRASAEPGDGPCRLAVVAPDTKRLDLARKVVKRGAPWRGRGDIWFTPQPLLTGPEQVAFLFPGLEPEWAPRTEGIVEALGLPAPRLHGMRADGSSGIVEQALDVVATGRLFAAALGELGITPGALAGHSLGEWTAMVVAGIFPDVDEFIATLRPGMVEFADLVYLALGAGVGRAAELTSGLDDVVLTHDNCPRQAVVCGPASQIAEAAARARAAGILAQTLPFRTGFHSPAFAPYVPLIRQSLQEHSVGEPRVPVWSATSLEQFPRDPDAMRDLVLRHLVEPVRFRELTGLLHDAGIRAFIQVGPGSLAGFAADTLDGREYLTVATAAPKADGIAQLRRAAAALWAEGLSPRFDRLGTAPSSAASASGVSFSPGASGGMPLRLGGPPLLRLAGRVETVPVGGSGPGRTASPGGHPALAELDALLAETAEAAESVVSAMAGQPPHLAGTHLGGTNLAATHLAGPNPAGAPPGTYPDWTRTAPPGPPTAGRPAPLEASQEREFSLRTMPDVVDHCLFPQPAGWPDPSDRFPVVPMTVLLEIMGDAALALRPGRVVVGLEQVRALRWLAVEPPTRTTVRAVLDPTSLDAASDGNDRVRVTIEGYASGHVLLADGYPPAPAPDEAPLHGQRPAPVAASELYTGGWLFHGPRFAGITNVAVLADDGITGTVVSLPTRGALLDSVGQLIGHWMQVSRTVDQDVLPARIGAVRRYGPQPPAGQPLDCTVRVRQVTDTEMRVDVELRADDGPVWCRIEGWVTRRFATDEVIWNVKMSPGTNTMSQQAPGGWSIVRERWSDTASREMIMRRHLNATERAEYERLNPLQQRRWLLGRIAVKDAVRRTLWERGAGPIYPVELTVTETETGTETSPAIGVRGPFQAPPVSLALSRPDSPGRPCAVAITGHAHAGFTIDTDADGAVQITEHGRVTQLVQPRKGN